MPKSGQKMRQICFICMKTMGVPLEAMLFWPWLKKDKTLKLSSSLIGALFLVLLSYDVARFLFNQIPTNKSYHLAIRIHAQFAGTADISVIPATKRKNSSCPCRSRSRRVFRIGMFILNDPSWSEALMGNNDQLVILNFKRTKLYDKTSPALLRILEVIGPGG